MSRRIGMSLFALVIAGGALVSHHDHARAQATSAPGSPTEQLPSAAPRTTPKGATFTAPPGWKLTQDSSKVLLEPPEADSVVAIIDVEAKDADEAVALGWNAYRLDARRPLKLSMPSPPRNGWEERRFYEYKTSPNERKVMFAVAWRAGTTWTVVIVDANEPTYEKRESQVSLALQSLRPKDYQRESFAGKKPHPLDAARIAAMKEFVASGMEQLGIPGAAFGLIDGGKVVFQGGLGVKELGKPAAVDADTLFMAASNTKGMTTLLLAQLVDEKRLSWDQPVAQAYPAFRLGDAETTSRVLIKHLVCACTGLPRQDMERIFEFAASTPASSMALLATMKPTSGFGEVFQYSNLMVAAAGYVAAATLTPKGELGAAYDQAMRTRVFEPLEMRNTTLDFNLAQRRNHARPHADDIDGKPIVVSMARTRSVVPTRPSGGVWTSARDLSKYVQMELARGRLPNGRPLVSEDNVLARLTPQVMVGEDVSYGMGLLVDKRWGVTIVRHGGALPGYRSDMIWLPEHGVGAVILMNSDSGWALLGPFLRRLVELVFDGRPEAREQLRVFAVQKTIEQRKTRERLVIPADPVEATKLARRYSSPELGTLLVRRDARGLTFDVGEWRSAMASRKNEDGTTSFVTIDPTLDGLDFVAQEREGKRILMLRDAQHEYTFVEETSARTRP